MALTLTREGASERERDYADLVVRVRELIESSVPEGATVAVVSRGDGEFLRLAGRNGWHFPRAASGAYAGHHPAGDDDAISRLEATRADGAMYLVFPATAYWWLDHYSGLKTHLESRYRRVTEVHDTGIVYSLSSITTVETPDGKVHDPAITQVRSLASSLLPVGSKVLVVTRGDDRLLDLGGPIGWHFPQRAGGYHATEDPPGGDYAIAQLNFLRQAGAEYLLVPRAAFPWLDAYSGFRTYLQQQLPVVTSQENVCTIYDLHAGDDTEQGYRSIEWSANA
jgi:hypothetical protein